MILSLRGGRDFWLQMLDCVEKSLDGEHAMISGAEGKSEDEIELRFLPADGDGSAFAVLVLPGENGDPGAWDGYARFLEDR